MKPFLFCDTSHIIERENAITIQVSEGRDSVDFAIVNAVSKYDIVITQDYGLAAMCLAKGAFVLNQNGKEFTDENIDQMLFFRHENAKFRRSGGKTKGPKKRTEKNNLDFEIKFRQICERAINAKRRMKMLELQRQLSEKEQEIMDNMKVSKPVLWINPNKTDELPENHSFTFQDVLNAEKRLQRFSAYIQFVFSETKKLQGIIESKLIEIPKMQSFIEKYADKPLFGKLLLKCDHELPISGSIKARGGIYEVLKLAEQIAIKHGFIQETDDYSKFADKAFQELFSQYKIAVGSTGNLGLSIGIMAAKLGFQTTVHMSMDAKEWKKQLLREKSVQVIEYESDYSLAVEEGRKQAEKDPMCHFVDDENSIDLFSGYAVGALRLKKQLENYKIPVNQEHPLFVYLPCGVGGGPGGVAFGLKALYKENVHIFFGEPTQSPCMLLGMMTGMHDQISVKDIGLTNRTEADGLAVGRPSKFVGKLMEPILSGCYTVEDEFLFESLKEMVRMEGIFMEPSSHASLFGPIQLLKEGNDYLEKHGLMDRFNQGTHIVWGTGGNMVPKEQREIYLNR